MLPITANDMSATWFVKLRGWSTNPVNRSLYDAITRAPHNVSAGSLAHLKKLPTALT
jgi:hypothetical protein